MTSISALRHGIGPSAVIRLVVAVWVNAVERQAVRANAHVAEKRGKGVPLVTNADSSPAITLITIGLRILATCSHAQPCVVGRGASPVRIVTMDLPVFCDQQVKLQAQTATAFRQPLSDAGPIDSPFSAAVTSTQVDRATVFVPVDKYQHGPSSVALSNARNHGLYCIALGAMYPAGS